MGKILLSDTLNQAKVLGNNQNKQVNIIVTLLVSVAGHRHSQRFARLQLLASQGQYFLILSILECKQI